MVVHYLSSCIFSAELNFVDVCVLCCIVYYFVDFEYFIKSTSPGSLTSSGASSAHMHAETPPVVSLGLASCDFSLDSMVRALQAAAHREGLGGVRGEDIRFNANGDGGDDEYH